MGSSDSKLVFKQGIFKLSEPSTIPAEDPYWAGVTPPLPCPYLRAMLTVTVVLGIAKLQRRCL